MYIKYSIWVFGQVECLSKKLNSSSGHTLFSTGMICKSLSNARKKLDTVWAWTPYENIYLPYIIISVIKQSIQQIIMQVLSVLYIIMYILIHGFSYCEVS